MKENQGCRGRGVEDGIMGIPQEDEAKERIRDLKRSLN
jgi:hypothetical protein